MSTNNSQIEIRPYNSKELAGLYNINIRTLRRWLRPHLPAIGARTGYYYTIPQIHIIFQKLGLPGYASD